jgi:hypothetical protein
LLDSGSAHPHSQRGSADSRSWHIWTNQPSSGLGSQRFCNLPLLLGGVLGAGGCAPIVATQSISSLKTTLPGETWPTLLQTFRTKIFLSLSDDFSAQIASELCGQDERWRVNYNISESGRGSRVSYLTGKPLADKAHVCTSKTYSQRRDYRFDMKTFTELKNAQSVTLA